MKTSIVQLDHQDDFISIRDKMAWCNTNRILLVFPDKGLKLGKRDLVLLLREAKSTGAQVAFVSQDESLGYLAAELGIPVFSSKKEAQGEFWKRVRGWRRNIRGTAPERKTVDKPIQTSSGWLETPIIRLSFFSSAVLAVIVLVVLFIPSAEITLYPAQETRSIHLVVKPNVNLAQVTIGGGIPASLRSVVVEAEESMASSGVVDLPQRAAGGVVELTNLTLEAIQIPAGLVVTTLRDPPTRFVITDSVTLGGKIGAKEEARIQAMRAGEDGNVGIGEIRAVEGPVGLKVTVTNPAATSGGTNQRTPAPTSEDRQRLKDKLIERLKQIAINEMTVGVGSDYLLVSSVQMRKTEVVSADPPDLMPGETLRFVIRAEFTGLWVKSADLQSLAEQTLNAGLEQEMKLVSNSTTATVLGETRREDAQVDWDVTVSGMIERKISQEVVLTQVMGLKKVDALRKIEHIVNSRQPADIRLTPPWLPGLPIMAFRIQIESR